MLEIEAKARIKNKGEIEQQIVKAGGKYISTQRQKDTYFAHPSRNFEKTDEALRIRTSGSEHFLTYKGPKLDKLTKTREEIEIKLEERGPISEMLNLLGFRKVATVKKTRANYALLDFQISIDDVDGLGHFIEVEKQGGEYKPEELVEALEGLGVKKREMEIRSYLELLLEKKEVNKCQ